VGYDGVAALNHPGIVTALIEGSYAHTQHGGIVHGTVDGSRSRADYHKMFIINNQVMDIMK
jgi:hypothetical protein